MCVRLSQFSLTGINPQIVKQTLCLNPQPELINRQTQERTPPRVLTAVYHPGYTPIAGVVGWCDGAG